MADEYVLWGIPEEWGLRIGASDLRVSPIPFGADIITRVEACDLRVMRRWCERRAKRGWSVSKMRTFCGEPPC